VALHHALCAWCARLHAQDSEDGQLLASKTYMQLYRDLRTAVDMCHRDGSLKKAVAANPAHYIHHVSSFSSGRAPGGPGMM
jgi:hypothetical protein